MLPWFLREPARLALEDSSLDALAASCDWLESLKWNVGAELTVDATIRTPARQFDVRLVYPDFFPDAPAYVPQQEEENPYHRR